MFDNLFFSAVAVVSAAILKGSHKGGLYQGIKGDIMDVVYRYLIWGDNVPGCGRVMCFVSVYCYLFRLVLFIDLIYKCLLFWVVVDFIWFD